MGMNTMFIDMNEVKLISVKYKSEVDRCEERDI